MIGYVFSDDYKRMKDLLDRGYSLVCIVPRKLDGVEKEVFCTAELKNKGHEPFEHYEVSFGFTSMVTWNKSMVDKMKGYYPSSFEEMMRNRRVRFIDFEI